MFVLNDFEVELLKRPNNGRGGFQSLIRRLNRNFEPEGKTLTVGDKDIRRIPKYAFDYKNGGFEDRLKGIFSRHLGPKLGR